MSPTLHTGHQVGQRGVATVAITLLLAFVVLLGVAFAHRNVLFEAKASANQYRAAQADAAAAAGVDWALAQLNGNGLVGDDCLASTDSAASLFRERILASKQAACTETAAGWSCHCPASGAPAGPADAQVARFSVQFDASARPGLLQLSSTGRSGGANSARSQLQVLLGRVPGLDALPAAALTVRGQATFSAGTFGLHHTSPATGGLTLHSGGGADTATLQLVSTPGTPPSRSVLAEEPGLAKLSAQGLFASLFRMDKAAWRAQPAVRELACNSACDAALANATNGQPAPALFWLRGGLKLDSPAVIGTPAQPVLLVADGPVELHAGAVIHGLVYSTTPQWTDTAGATVRGAVIVEGDLQASGSTQIHHDEAVLQALHTRSGSHAAVPGSWHDF